MRAIATAALVALVWMCSTAPSLSQSGGVIQFGPFQFPVFGGAQLPLGPFVVGATSGRAHRAPPLVANTGGSPMGSRPTAINKPAVKTESLSNVIGGSRVKF